MLCSASSFINFFKNKAAFLFVLVIEMVPGTSLAQKVKSSLTIEKIMQGTGFTGTSPSEIAWSEDSRFIYFKWNPEKARADSLYKVTATGENTTKVNRPEADFLPTPNGRYNRTYTLKVYEKEGDIYLYDNKTNTSRQLTKTLEPEANPVFSGDEQQVVFTQNSNLFSLHLSSGQLTQLTNFLPGAKKTETKNDQEKWLQQQQLALFDIIKKRTEEEKIEQSENKKFKKKQAKAIYTGEKTVENAILSPDGKFVSYSLVTRPANVKKTIVPDYVTASGFTEDISSRTKVGAPLAASEMGLYDIGKDTTYQISFKDIKGITDQPAFLKDKKKITTPRPVAFFGPFWSDNGKNAVLVLRSFDNKDRWLVQFNPGTRALKVLDRQHDEAWLNGPGIDYEAGDLGWLGDNETLWFQSEETGYSHVYTVNTRTNQKKQITKGKYEVSAVRLTRDKKNWYFQANKVHPGEMHFYRLAVRSGEPEQLTTGAGNHEVTLSPDEKTLAIRYSYTNKPWELFVMPNRTGAKPRQVTNSLTNEFKAYQWRDPEVISFKARDGAEVFARIYRPTNAIANGPAVVFVHGAGYLQNAHKWWSYYYREYMFHNFLVDQGYTVMDLDYRGSAGYGRDVRTGIYQFMGGKDLTDQVDGAAYLVQHYQVNPRKIGIYGGSYGGFITLMALFTQPDVFAAGAALRSVTDWAHYNHEYTSAILNEPFTDSTAYVKSSPIYHAAGLKGALLMCHGLVDTNVHFQDIIRLTQRLIELKKENWELAVYPVENHAFTEPSSWTDEYKRIFKLFEANLK
ncbi:prolyl oligopeptidase family serine peptidase [Adhaeribacter pallidiroseus]|uniref:Dipeptidyl-peptidase IV n=1 Tax=Adhaeribacter pallidiroseus TaxID=2072847 RepID=A0A369QP20_9BACT|nr:prolyl oligopeptidase family serine peptidase [Adhaeribacter pallidiroseus]RDC65007.1 Dipeptidyl-peptidase IV [Adhaeribacter pallidiroseus]